MHVEESTLCHSKTMFRGCVKDVEESTKVGAGASANTDLNLDINMRGDLALPKCTSL